MKLPSLQSLFQGVKRVLMRFPIQTLLAFAAVFILWYLVDPNKEAFDQGKLVSCLAVCNLALTLTLSADLFCEAHQYSLNRKWIFRMIGLAICTGLYFILHPWSNEADIFRIFMLALAFHLLVAFAPYIGKSNLNGFWQYNKSLFLRILTAGFYAGVLYLGLCAALMAIDQLFNVTINYKIYWKLFSFIGIGFTTIFFLAGVPDNVEELAEDHSYPKGLKIFTQYVLIPLMTIYLAILLVYEVTIIISWSLPKGLVSMLILGYAVFGILSLLLVYPIKDKEGNGWVRLFSRFFYLMMIPLIVLLFLAIGMRIGKYGITESRYILIALAIWLSFITLYFLFSKKQNIKIIPISLCIVTLLAVYGPQSAFSVSRFSQQLRLTKLMTTKGKNVMKEKAEVVRYLVSRHGLPSLQKFTKTDLDQLEEKMDSKGDRHRYLLEHNKIDTAFALLKIKDSVYTSFNYFEITSSDNGVIMTDGYTALHSFETSLTDVMFRFDHTDFKIEKSKSGADQKRLSVTAGTTSVIFDLDTLVNTVYQDFKDGKLKKTEYSSAYIYQAKQMEFVKQSGKYMFKIVITDFNGSYDESENDYDSLNFTGYLLIKKN